MRCHLCGHDLDGFLGGHFSNCPAQRQLEAIQEQNRLLEQQREAQEVAGREASKLDEEAAHRATRGRLRERGRSRRAAREAAAAADKAKDVARRLHELGLEYRRLLRTVKIAPQEALLASLSLVERLRIIEPADVEPAQRATATDLVANAEDARAAASHAAGADAEPLERWFSLELERFQLVNAALARTVRDHAGDLAARNPSDDSLRNLLTDVAHAAQRYSATAADALALCPETPPSFLTDLSSEPSPTMRFDMMRLKREAASGSVSLEFVEELRKEVATGLALAARSAEDALGPRPKLFGRANWDEQHERWLVQQRSDASDTVGKYRVLRIAAEAVNGLAESLRCGREALEAIFAFDRDETRGAARKDLEGRYEQLSEVMWRELTKVRPRVERRDDLEELAASAEDDADEIHDHVRELHEELGVTPEGDSFEDIFGDDE